jgi:hypothetical protein
VSAAASKQAVEEIQELLQRAVSNLKNEVSKLPVIGGLAAHGLSFSIPANAFDNIEQWVQELLFQHSVLTGYWNAVQNSTGVAFIRNPFVQVQAAAAGNGSN